MIQPFSLKYYTDDAHGYTPTSFALAQIVHNTASLIDEWIDHNEVTKLSELEKKYLNALIKKNNKLVTEWSERYGDAYSNWREEIK